MTRTPCWPSSSVGRHTTPCTASRGARACSGTFVTEGARYAAAFADADYGVIIYTYRRMEDPPSESEEVPES